MAVTDIARPICTPISLHKSEFREGASFRKGGGMTCFMFSHPSTRLKSGPTVLARSINMLHSSLSHLESIDQRFLDPDASLVVMCQDTENALDDAH